MDTRTSDQVDRVMSLMVVVVLGELWVSDQGDDDDDSWCDTGDGSCSS